MRTIYAIQLQLMPPDGRPASAVFADLSTRICQWAETKYQRAWATTLAIPIDGQVLTPLADHSIRALSRTASDSSLFSFDWTHPADSDRSTAWVTSCVVARHGDAVQLSLLLRISTTRVVLRPVRFDLGRPRIVTDLLDAYRATMDGWPVPMNVEHLASPQVQGYVDTVLLNSNRNLPVIMISPIAWSGRYAVDPVAIFERVKGFAHVAALTDKWAGFKLTDVVEKPLSCYEGAVRVYWPGFKLDDSPFQHKLFLSQSIQDHEDQGLPLQDHLFRMLSAVASFRYTEGSVIRAVRQVLIDLEKRRVDDLREQIKTGSVEKESLELQLLEALEQIDKIAEDRDKLKADLAAQQAAWAEVQQAMAAGEQETSEPQPEAKARFETVLDAVEQAKKDFSGPLLFLDSALESAKNSPYQAPERVYELLEALYSVASDWKKKKGRLGRSWNDAIAEFGFDLRDQVSQTSKGKFGSEYRFFHKGHKQLFERHITIGAKQPDKCLTVHWYRDDDDLVLAIGHCGRHLSNTSS